MRSVSRDRDLRPRLRVLEHDAHPLAERALAAPGVEAEHRDVAGVARAVALEDLDGRRLARAVRAEQAEDLALLDREGDPADGLLVAVGLAQPADVDRGGHQSSTATTPAGGNAGSGPPLSAATFGRSRAGGRRRRRVSPRPEAASRTASGSAPGASRSSASALDPDGLRDLLCGLSRAHEWARENGVRADPVVREPLAELAGLLTSLLGQRANLVGLTAGGLGVTHDEEPHPGSIGRAVGTSL